MGHIRIIDGKPVRYSLRKFINDNPQVSVRVPIPEKVLSKFGVFALALTPKPDFDRYTQKVVDGDAVLIGDKWTQTWSVVDLEGQELAAAKARAATKARAAAKAQAYIDNLPSWSQVEKTVDAISNLSEAKAFLKKLARVVYWDVKNTET